jgi:hypothetical protein
MLAVVNGVVETRPAKTKVPPSYEALPVLAGTNGHPDCDGAGLRVDIVEHPDGVPRSQVDDQAVTVEEELLATVLVGAEASYR